MGTNNVSRSQATTDHLDVDKKKLTFLAFKID